MPWGISMNQAGILAGSGSDFELARWFIYLAAIVLLFSESLMLSVSPSAFYRRLSERHGPFRLTFTDKFNWWSLEDGESLRLYDRRLSSSDDDDHYDAPAHPGAPLLVLVFGLAVGVFSKAWLNKVKLPYTALLFVSGIALGVIVARCTALFLNVFADSFTYASHLAGKHAIVEQTTIVPIFAGVGARQCVAQFLRSPIKSA